MKNYAVKPFQLFAIVLMLSGFATTDIAAQVGVGAKAPKGAKVLFDGSREMLDKKLTVFRVCYFLVNPEINIWMGWLVLR